MDIIADWMRRENLPMTREVYLANAYWEPPEELGAEEEAMLPRWAQIDPAEEFNW
jgi:hypothetical protein